MNILFKFPSRQRPEKLLSCLQNIKETCSTNYLVVCTLDSDDETMNNPEMIKKIGEFPNTVSMFGKSDNKIHAVNRDMDEIDYPWDIVVVMSDDMKIMRKGFDTFLRSHFEKNGLDSILHLNDGNAYGNRLMTMNIQGRDNYNRFGYLYNPEYKSLWCDNEQMAVGKIIGNYYYVPFPIYINHLHPAHVAGLVSDDLLRHTESFYREDEATFNRRKKKNFDL